MVVEEEELFQRLTGNINKFIMLQHEVSDYKEDYPFHREVDSLVLANAKINISTAFQKFFDGSGNYPAFKKKSGRQSTAYVADVNEALNIMRKSSVVDLNILYGRGEVDTPVRIRIA